MTIRILIATILILGPVSNLFPEEKGSTTILIMGGISSGTETVDYSLINDKLKVFNFHEINDLCFPSISAVFKSSRLLIDASIFYRYGTQEDYSSRNPHKVSISRLSNSLKVGAPLFAGAPGLDDYTLFPYLGLSLEYLYINMNNSSVMKTPDFFFNGKSNYLIHDIAFLYGIGCHIPMSESRFINFIFKIDAGGTISASHKRWSVVGDPLRSTFCAPKFDLSNFLIRFSLNTSIWQYHRIN